MVVTILDREGMDRLTPARLDAILDAARTKRVLVVGDAMLDVYLRGVASRISPEAPVPVVRVTDERWALGGAANVAANVVALGALCALVGVTGQDEAGARLREAVVAAGIAADGLLESGLRQTTVKTRIVTKHHQIARFDREMDEDLDERDARSLAERIGALASEADAIVLEDYNKGVLTKAVIEAALAAGRRAAIPVVVDPKARFFFDYVGATVFKPNQAELEAALREPVAANDAGWLERTRERLGSDHLLVTLGDEGMALMTSEGEYVRVPSAARAVFDVSGAGDTVTAAVVVALAAGATPAEAAILANHAAGIEVGKLGVATVSPAELREVVQANAKRSSLQS
ncbi:MAG: bifunctional heptose 7-phosphate kinase/heptose 1-phosphate adenyltransferase [Longimicrobiales bacterium]